MASGHTSRYSHYDVDEFDEEFIDEPFQVITNKSSWKVSSVSPLHNLQYSIVKLKQYALKVKQMLTASVTEKSSVRYKTSFAIDKKLKLQADDPDALYITVTARNSDDESANYNLVYEAVMLSWGVFVTKEHATHLPYMLDRGSAKLTKSVRTALTKLFDCCISNIAFTQNDLLLFNAYLAMLSKRTTKREKAPNTYFIYTLLHSELREKITIEIDVASLNRWWKSVCTDELDELVLSRKKHFALNLYHNIQNYIYNTFDLDVAMMELVEIVYPQASVKVNGVVRMKEASVVRCFLKILNDVMPNIPETN